MELCEKSLGLGFVCFQMNSLSFSINTSSSLRLDAKLFNEIIGNLDVLKLKKHKNTPSSRYLFRVVDVNNDGAIDIEEFLKAITIIQSGSLEERLWSMLLLVNENSTVQITD